MPRGDGLVLGLDIGVQSIGWALLRRQDGRFTGIESLGSRIFEAGVEGDVVSGRDEAKGVKRRLKRQHRRLLKRRVARLRGLAGILQGAGLLPAGEIDDPQARKAYFDRLDAELFPHADRQVTPHVLPYRLRADALDRKLTPFQIGRALYHLAHRRGYRPVEREGAREDKEQNKIETEISLLAKQMQARGAHTVGEYFAGLDPAQERIRGWWTSRGMFEEEFDKIWTAQTAYAPDILTQILKKCVHRAIFYQRPVHWDRNTIGQCDLELGEKRAPLCILPAQRFRLLQKVNDLRLTGLDPDTGKPIHTLRSESLTADERDRLVTWLETDGDVNFNQLRNKKHLNLPKWVRFNHEETDDKKLIGNRTAVKIRKVIGQVWDTMTAAQRDALVEDLRCTQKAPVMERWATQKWRLDSDQARALALLRDKLEDGHCNLSRKALGKILPFMEKGLPFATARKEVYGAEKPPESCDVLPPIDRAPIPDLRNPSVGRALTELRKVVNGVVGKYGKPVEIRIELARDLKRGRKERKLISAKNYKQRAKRQEARETLEQWLGRVPSERDVEKHLLWEECDKTCPYTGRPINKEALFGPTPQFDVEHIIPLSRSLDDSYLNKTLCALEENRGPTRKANKTPWETYGQDAKKWGEIMQRVRHFKGDAAEAKRERFQLQTLEEFEDFTNRQLSDTRYASRLAIQYLGLLYGTGANGVDDEGCRCIQVGRGGVTKFLRDEYGLNRILGDGGTKSRADHRHHAVDAVAIALTDAARVQELSQAADQAWSCQRRRFAPLPPPWTDFMDEVRRHVEGIAVSHRVSRKVNAEMHKETFYAKRTTRDGNECIHVRELLGTKTTKNLIDQIVDPAVRHAVHTHLATYGGAPARAFGDIDANPPRMASGVPIRRVRIAVRDKVVQVGQGARARLVTPKSNHHMEIVAKGMGADARWHGVVVTTMDAMDRIRRGKPVVQRQWPEGENFVCSVSEGELFEMKSRAGELDLCRVRSVSGGKVEFVSARDARKKELIKKDEDQAWFTRSPNELRKLGFHKVVVTPLGEVRNAND